MTKLHDAISEYQCPGCVCGGAPSQNCEALKLDKDGCSKHVVGTFIMGLGHIVLGLPKGFARVSETQGKIRIFPTKEDYASHEYDHFNVPVWKYKNEKGHVLVRVYMPRIDTSSIHIHMDGSYFHEIRATYTVTDEMLKGMTS